MGKKKPAIDDDLDPSSPGVGHNNVAAEQLRSYVERYERLNEDKADISEQQKDLMAEAKANGYDVKAIKKIIALRKLEPAEFAEQQNMIRLYAQTLGMSILDSL
jgi:uncharacterized protein (UPF0335 family)